jgi:uncharacterized repeat protein (TIGR02543 family)
MCFLGASFFFCMSCSLGTDVETLRQKVKDREKPATIPTYTVTFHKNGATSGIVPEAQAVSAGSAITLPGKGNLARTGYVFNGWNTNAEGTGSNYLADSLYTPTGNIALYASWNTFGAPCTVNFNANGATGGTAPAAIGGTVGNSNIELPGANGLTKTGYEFGGWNTSASGDGASFPAGFTYPVTGNATLYAKWNPITYTIRYDKNAADAIGTTADSSHTYDVEKALTANGYTHTDYVFGGWNALANGGGANYADGENVKNLTSIAEGVFILYAVWVRVTQDELNFGITNISKVFNVSNTAEWNSAVSSITGGGNNKTYIINIMADFSVTGRTTVTLGNISGVKVSLRGNGKTLTLSGNGHILYIENNQGIIMRDLTLLGHGTNNNSLVYMGSNGVFTMNGGKISSNTASGSGGGGGGGVYVSSGTFTMNGGEISGNTTNYGGGGVYVYGGIFIMNGGEISGNTAPFGGGVLNHSGGGVSVKSGGTFTMNNGEISGNTASFGGGVHVLGIFTMHDGEISGNTANNDGGGVNVSFGIFTMHDGEISGNTTNYDGGGVNVSSGTFTMHDGEISGNTTNYGVGGGVSVLGIFTMHDGEISGNIAYGGGGVHVSYGSSSDGDQFNGTFRIVMGTIYGSNELDTSLKNTASRGAALDRGIPSNIAQHGIFIDGEWESKGDLDTTNDTIRVVNGNLQ